MPLEDLINQSNRDLNTSFDVASRNNKSFPIQTQRMGNWCWAACTCSLLDFYRRSSGRTQESIVAAVLGKPICNNPTAPPPLKVQECNYQWKLDDILERTGLLVNYGNYRLTPAQIIAELNSGRPFCCQIYFRQSGATHFVIVFDYILPGDGVLYLRVADPIDSALKTMTYEELARRYRAYDTLWDKSYLTH